MPYLLLYHVGPVQGFIASARRTRDLWFGSHLLSELARAGAQRIVTLYNNNPENLIFPAPEDENTLKEGAEINVANKILARLPDGDKTLPDGYPEDKKRLNDRRGIPTYVGGEVKKAIDLYLEQRFASMLVEIYEVGSKRGNDDEKDAYEQSLNLAKEYFTIAHNEKHEKYEKIVKDLDDSLNKIKEIQKAVSSRRKLAEDATHQQIHDADRDRHDFDETVAHQQVMDLVEQYWVATSYEEGKDEEENNRAYADTRQKLESLLAARKNTRDYRHAAWGSGKPKSSIDGNYESIIDWDLYNNSVDNETRKANAQLLYRYFKAGPNEQLSGIDLLKRRSNFSQTQEDFLSTGHLAALSYLERLRTDTDVLADRQNLTHLWGDYRSEIWNVIGKENVEERMIPPSRRGDWKDNKPEILTNPILENYDGELLFEQSINDDAFPVKKNSQQAEKKERTLQLKVQVARKKFFDAVNDALKTQPIKPSPYYAIISADGDGMGSAIEHHAKQGHEKHQGHSRLLANFARGVKNTVLKHKGSPIYAGGDDVLALLPLHTALKCASDIEHNFREALKSEDTELIKDGLKPLTLSVGITIVHYHSLLSDSLELARETEKAAKRVDGKHGLAISLSKRSGETYTVAFSWDDLPWSDADEKRSEQSYFLALINAYRTELLPRGSAYELRDTAQRFALFNALATRSELNDALVIPQTDTTDARTQHDSGLKEVYEQETKRILRRKLNLPTEDDKDSDKDDDRLTNEERRRREIKRKKRALLNQLLGREKELFPAALEDTGEGLRPLSELQDELAKLQNALSEFIQEMIVAEALADAQDLAEGPHPEKVSEKAKA